MKPTIEMPAISCIVAANCSCHWCNQRVEGAITLLREQLHMKTTLHVQLIVTKQKGAGEENLAHQIITPTSYACQLQEEQWDRVLSTLLNIRYYYQRIFRGLILKEQLVLAIQSPFANMVSIPQIKPPKSPVKYLVLWKMQGFNKILVCIDFFISPGRLMHPDH